MSGSLSVALGMVVLVGCTKPAATPVRLASPASLDRVLAAPVMTTVAGLSVEGRPIERWSYGSGGETVLIIASLHGDEAAGTPLVARLADELAAHPGLLQGRTVVFVPQANPDGLARGRRTNGNGVDLNRNFPAENYSERRRSGAGPLSEPESRALHDLIREIAPDRVISLHQPLRCIDYDGPAAALAAAMSAACDLPVRRLGARPGSLGSFVGLELGIPIVTVELPGAASRWSDEKLWEKYGPMLLAAVAFD